MVELECVVLLEIGGGICKTVQSRLVLRVNCCESWLNWNVLLLELHVIVHLELAALHMQLLLVDCFLNDDSENQESE
ncbi:hypothetical protein Tco_1162601 [Tanacetum coccineum]